MSTSRYKNKTNYNKRVWLNNYSCSSTGSVVAFDGEKVYAENDIEKYRFLEISDCKRKITLHQTEFDSDIQFINKLKKLKLEIELFIKHLEK